MSINIDEDIANADWLRSLQWDGAIDAHEFAYSLGADDDDPVVIRSLVKNFLSLPAAEQMPEELIAELQELGWWPAGVSKSHDIQGAVARSLSKMNPNHDRRGRFATGPGRGPGGHTSIVDPRGTGTLHLKAMGDAFEIIFTRRVSKSKSALAALGGGPITNLVGGGGNRLGPIDATSKKFAIEIKTCSTNAKDPNATLAGSAVKRKTEAAKKMGKKGAIVIQLVDPQTHTVHLFLHENFHADDKAPIGSKATKLRPKESKKVKKIGRYRYTDKELADVLNEHKEPISKYNPYHGAHGRFTSPGGRVAAVVSREGGATLDDNNNLRPVKSGYAVSEHPERSMTLSADKMNARDIDGWMRKNADILSDPAVHVGAWHDPNTNQVWLDVVHVFPNTSSGKAAATKAGKRSDQIAMFHLDDRTPIPLGGTGVGKSARRFTVFAKGVTAEDIIRWVKGSIEKALTEDGQEIRPGDTVITWEQDSNGEWQVAVYEAE